ncbi:MAG: 6-phosphogluconolactonase [Cyanobacteria bacterium P01_C01_bin.72]
MVILNQNIEVLADKPALVERGHEIVLELMRSTIEAQGRFTIALAGGSTPRPLYAALAEDSLPWSKIHVFWGDERYVPADHPDSNQLMARTAWLDKIDIPPSNIHPMQITGENPQQDAQRHETELKEFFGLSQGFPSFDLILLGMGDDGHTASLFPHTEALKEREHWVTVGNKDGQPRLTFSIPLINQAKNVVFLVSGENKRAALQQIFALQGDATAYPSRQIQPRGELLWLLDQAAAVEL